MMMSFPLSASRGVSVASTAVLTVVTPEARRMIVLAGVVFALLALGAGMLRTRWNVLLIGALSAAFVAATIWISRFK
jgi:hypothetical protein